MPGSGIPETLSLLQGGPTHRLQARLGLQAVDGLPTVRAGLIVAAFAWGPLAMLAAFDARNWNFQLGSSFYTDFGTYARFLLAIFILIVTERLTDRRLNRLLASFAESGIVGVESRDDFLAMLAIADARTSSGRAELVMLLAAFGSTTASTLHTLQVNPDIWLSAGEGIPGPLSLAGWWLMLVSMPLFHFLVIRWFWRFGVWTALLKKIASLPLQLVPTHPDKSGGLGFLTLLPVMFVPLAFSLSAVVASQALQEILFDGATFEVLRATAIAWVIFVLVISVGPLAVFSGPLIRLRERAILDYGELVARNNRQAERQLHSEDAERRVLDASTISAVADIAAGLDTIYSIKVLPVQLWSIVPLALSAIAPMIAVAAVQVPIQTILARILGAIF